MNDTLSRHQMLTSKAWKEHIKPGHKFDIQLLDHSRTRFFSSLVGHHSGEFMVFQFDSSLLPSSVALTGMVVIGRFMIEGEVGACYAFKSEVTHTLKYPYSTFFIGFPDEIQHRPIRETKRRTTDMPAQITVRKKHSRSSPLIQGRISDISEGGCRFIFEEPTSSKTVKHLPIQVVFEHQAEPCSVDGIIRNSKRTEDGLLSVGIEFESAPPETVLASI
ncbi:hypothetical protein HMF8227_02677 [Saliniradius amylolyticus]|uniref:PilZ domain-containing protein n=1 Tax=Saliniradius amylolyticus TaxID=2183582 RepID=A0A2S2E6A2_9ALTE|nr:PilZ domain-containing protein [Saliniradius amylolyticus]AWL13129.1 hypothetical protein HMF8227_02677 [Saliniradius amylolyticus]